MRRLLLTLALALWPALAEAQSANNGWGGYVYPNGQNSALCAPLCTSAQMEWRVPTISDSGAGSPQRLVIWLGIEGSTSTSADQSNCPGVFCLGQFGTISQWNSGVVAHQAWYELFCPNGAGSVPIACDPAEVLLDTGAFPVASGDRIIASMACISGCSPAYSTSAKWAVSIQDVTAGWTWNNGSAGHSGAGGVPCTTGVETSCFNWPLGQAFVAFVAEADNGSTAAPSFNPIPVTGVLINGATPVWTDIKRAALFQNRGSRTLFPSQLTNGKGNSFYICRASGSYSASSSICPTGGGYAGDSSSGVR